MKREIEQNILVRSPEVTDLLKKLIQKAGEAFTGQSIPNLADYSTKFRNIR